MKNYKILFADIDKCHVLSQYDCEYFKPLIDD